MYKGEFPVMFVDMPISAAASEIVARHEIPQAIFNARRVDSCAILQSLCYDMCQEILKEKQYSITETDNHNANTTTVEMRVNVAEPGETDAYVNEKVCKIGSTTFSMSEVRNALEHTFSEQFSW